MVKKIKVINVVLSFLCLIACFFLIPFCDVLWKWIVICSLFFASSLEIVLIWKNKIDSSVRYALLLGENIVLLVASVSMNFVMRNIISERMDTLICLIVFIISIFLILVLRKKV